MKNANLLAAAFATAAASIGSAGNVGFVGDIGSTKRGGTKHVGTPVPVLPASSKVHRNAVCSCGSGKKAKKCCDASHSVSPAVASKAAEFMAAPKGAPQTVTAMLHAGISPAEVYAYYHTATYIPEDNRSSKTANELAIWDAHVSEFINCSVALQNKIITDISRVAAE